MTESGFSSPRTHQDGGVRKPKPLFTVASRYSGLDGHPLYARLIGGR